MGEIAISRATFKDLETISRLHADAMSKGEHFSGMSSSMASVMDKSANSMAFLARKNGVAVGLRSVHNLNTPAPHLGMLFITNSERNAGLGKQLTLHALGAVFSREHVEKVSGKILENDEKKFSKAKAAYESMGFTVEESGVFHILREDWLKRKAKEGK